MEVWKYDSVDLSTIVNRIPDKVLDDLPFGLIKLDFLGKILEYNMAEAALTGFTRESVIGKNFFLEVATCTQTPEFYGRVREGVDKGLLNVQFDYLFNSEMIPTRVRVRMVRMNQHVWLMVTRLNPQGQAIDIARAPNYVPPQQTPYEYIAPAPVPAAQSAPMPLPLAPTYSPSHMPMYAQPPAQPFGQPQPPAFQPAPPQFQPPQYPPQQPTPQQPPLPYPHQPQQPQYAQPPLYPQAPGYPQPPAMQPQYAPAPTFAPQPAPVPAPAAPAPRKSSGLEDFDFS